MSRLTSKLANPLIYVDSNQKCPQVSTTATVRNSAIGQSFSRIQEEVDKHRLDTFQASTIVSNDTKTAVVS